MLRRAASIAFWMAWGTSRALPRPKPTRPLPSPTTVSAVKANIRPPFTVLATRFTWTSFSCSPSFGSTSLGLLAMIQPLEFQSAFAGRIGESLDATVILETAAVKRDLFYTSGAGALGNQLTNRTGGVDVAGLALAERFVQGGGTGQHLVAFRRDHLCVNVA